jgi:hypothetical protein
MTMIERVKISKNKTALLSTGEKRRLTGNVGISELGEWAEIKEVDGTKEKVLVSKIIAIQTSLSPDWCDCGHETFGSYPQDGECACGMHKHHVHCGTCGKISQVG